MYSLLHRVVVTKPLPLRIYRVHTSARKNTLLDEPLPVNLILVLLAGELLSHSEYLDQLSDSEPRALTAQLLDQFQLVVLSCGRGHLNLHDDVAFHGQTVTLLDLVDKPLVRNKRAR